MCSAKTHRRVHKCPWEPQKTANACISHGHQKFNPHLCMCKRTYAEPSTAEARMCAAKNCKREHVRWQALPKAAIESKRRKSAHVRQQVPAKDCKSKHITCISLRHSTWPCAWAKWHVWRQVPQKRACSPLSARRKPQKRVRLPKHVFPVSGTQSPYVWALGMFFPVSGTQSHHVWALGFRKTFSPFLVPDLVTYGR